MTWLRHTRVSFIACSLFSLKHQNDLSLFGMFVGNLDPETGQKIQDEIILH